MENFKPTVYSTTKKIIYYLYKKSVTSAGKASLAKLRNSAGLPLNESSTVWPIILDKMPVEFLGTTGSATYEEKSVLVALQLYAIHQQGNENLVNKDYSEEKWRNIGSSLGKLRTKKNEVAMNRRFNMLITSSDFDELTHHLRQSIKILKSQSGIEVDYAKLAEDLYWFQRGYAEKVKLNWSRSYYSTNLQREEEND